MYTDINGIKTNYLTKGNGTPLLILHGWGCNAAVYTSLTNYLEKHYHVFLPELPGFGETAEPPEPWGVTQYAEFVTAFCKAVNIEPAVILAHSLGCRIAAKLLSSNTLTPEKVVFTGAAGIKPKKTLSQKVKIRLFKIKKLFLKPFPNLTQKLQSKSGSADYRNASPIMRQCLVKIVNEDLTHLLPEIKNDLLLIWGENDDSTPLSDGQLMEKLIENSGLAVIKNAGHYAFLEQPVLFEKILNSYLGDNK
ncbi:MAG: alpha/beta hydrolase [Oscillospiraceae bacterium]|nr:alpha/beta hydrolase [Oscillospiraceae bacterium]